MTIKHLERIFLILWIILPFVVLATIGIIVMLFLMVFAIFFMMGLQEGKVDWIKTGLGGVVKMLLLYGIAFIPTLIMIFLNKNIKKYHIKKLRIFYSISIIIALLIILILVILAIQGKFTILGF